MSDTWTLTAAQLMDIRRRHPSKLKWDERVMKAAKPNRFKRQLIAYQRWAELRHYTG